jgi:hypothetical protein
MMNGVGGAVIYPQSFAAVWLVLHWRSSSGRRALPGTAPTEGIKDVISDGENAVGKSFAIL